MPFSIASLTCVHFHTITQSDGGTTLCKCKLPLSYDRATPTRIRHVRSLCRPILKGIFFFVCSHNLYIITFTGNTFTFTYIYITCYLTLMVYINIQHLLSRWYRLVVTLLFFAVYLATFVCPMNFAIVNIIIHWAQKCWSNTSAMVFTLFLLLRSMNNTIYCFANKCKLPKFCLCYK